LNGGSRGVDLPPHCRIQRIHIPAHDVARLSADIKENGLREPIHVFNDAIIDGRNRYNACEMAGVRPEFLDYQGDEAGLVRFSISLNLHRRHLNESQRAMVANTIANLEQGRPEKGQICTLKITQNEDGDMYRLSVWRDVRRVLDEMVAG